MDNNTDENHAEKDQTKLVSDRKIGSFQADFSDHHLAMAQPPRRWLMGISVFLCFILSAVSVASVAYLYILSTQQKQLFQLEIQAQRQLINGELDQQQQNVQLKIQPSLDKINTIENQQQQIKNSLAKLNNLPIQQALLTEKVTMLANRNPSHWMAAEAGYLVNMAERKLWVEHDPTTALVLLQDADNRIETMNEPNLLPLRKALSQDILAVKGIKISDISSSVIALDKIFNLIPALPLNSKIEPQIAASKQDNTISSSVSDWRTNLSKTWQSLIDDFVTIQHRKADIAALISPKEQWFLIANIQTKLLQAQLALFHNDKVNYQQALTTAEQWITQFYNGDSTEVKQVKAELSQLMTIDLAPSKLPTLKSPPLLKQLVATGELIAPSTEEQLL